MEILKILIVIAVVVTIMMIIGFINYVGYIAIVSNNSPVFIKILTGLFLFILDGFLTVSIVEDIKG